MVCQVKGGIDLAYRSAARHLDLVTVLLRLSILAWGLAHPHHQFQSLCVP